MGGRLVAEIIGLMPPLGCSSLLSLWRETLKSHDVGFMYDIGTWCFDTTYFVSGVYREGLVSALRAYIGIAVGGADFIILQGKMDFFEPYFFFDRG